MPNMASLDLYELVRECRQWNRSLLLYFVLSHLKRTWVMSPLVKRFLSDGSEPLKGMLQSHSSLQRFLVAFRTESFSEQNYAVGPTVSTGFTCTYFGFGSSCSGCLFTQLGDYAIILAIMLYDRDAIILAETEGKSWHLNVEHL